MKTYIINLKRSTDRREHILKETARFPFLDVEFVDAVDGRELSAQEEARLFDRQHFMDRYYARFPLPGEVGCTLSHRECYRRLLQSGEEYALILEDDAVFLHPGKIASLSEACKELIPCKADVILCALRSVVYKRGKINRHGLSFCPLYTGFSTAAYVISRKGAGRILQKDKLPSMVADDWKAIRRMGVTVYAVSPVVVAGDTTMRSTINEAQKRDKSRLSWHSVKYRAYVRLDRAYCRFCKRYGIMTGIDGNTFNVLSYI